MGTLQLHNMHSKDLPGKSETLPEMHSGLVDAEMLTSLSLCGAWSCACRFEEVIHHFKFHGLPKESCKLISRQKIRSQ